MKLIVIIPAYNEEKTISQVISRVPRRIIGVDEVLIIVVDDGSQDNTAVRARDAGADIVALNDFNRGLAETFYIGLEKALSEGADIIVNIDADGQHNPAEIVNVIQPILKKQAGLVVGCRQLDKLSPMKSSKLYGNKVGNFIVGILTGYKNLDVSSGFRAFSRETALRLNIFFGHTYTHQSIIEARYKNIKIASVPISYQARADNSRLISGFWLHVFRSFFIIVRTLIIYKPLRTFFGLGSLFILLGFALGVRYLYYFYLDGPGRIQSLILMTIVMIFGIVMYVIGFLGDLIAINRRLSEDINYRAKKEYYHK